MASPCFSYFAIFRDEFLAIIIKDKNRFGFKVMILFQLLILTAF